MITRPAQAVDVPAIHALVKTHAERGKMILRSLDELYSNLREFMVAEEERRIVGCAATHIFSSDLAELKCVAVLDECQGQGIGRALCDSCLADLQQLGISRVFTLTSTPGFFEKIGYRRVEKDSLPHIIWGECVRCPSFPICKEDALLRNV